MAYSYKREDRAYGYDKDTDYSQKMSEAAAAGDYASAARYEQQRNEKIKGEGLTQYQPTRQYAQYLPKSDMRSAENVLDRILSRDDFSYDLGGDALYRQYKDHYLQQGKLAMQDTMGQAAALTGGYGNSYAQTVGQQAYDRTLDSLNDVIPELYSLALRRYEKEGDDLWDLYGIYADREAQDYERYLDARDFNYRQEWDNKNFDYRQEWDNKNFDYQQEWNNRNFDYEQAQTERNTAFELAMWMLQSGVMPSDSVLTSAGLSAADAQAIYGKITTPHSVGAGGSKTTEKAIPSGKELATLAERYKAGGYKAIAGDMAYYKKTNMDTDWISYYLSLYDEEEATKGGYQGGNSVSSGRSSAYATLR